MFTVFDISNLLVSRNSRKVRKLSKIFQSKMLQFSNSQKVPVFLNVLFTFLAGNNFCEFLFTFLDDQFFLKRGLL